MTWSQFESKPKKEDEVVVDKVSYTPISITEKYGLNVAILGMEMTGKSILSSLFGYFNSDYISKMGDYPNTIKLLKGGYMPEVEKIQVLDLDASFAKSCSRGIFKSILSPLISGGKIEVTEIYIPRRQQVISDDRIKDANVQELERCKNEIEAAISQAVKDNDPSVLYIIDSMSAYNEVLNNRFKVIYEHLMNGSSLDSVKGVKQAFWTIRNAWLNSTMKKKRGYSGWQVDTYKVTATPDWVLKKQKSEGKTPNRYSIQWGSANNSNAFNLDMIYWLHRDDDGLPYVNIENGRYKSSSLNDNIHIYYELGKRTAALSLIERMAPFLMEEKVEEDMW